MKTFPRMHVSLYVSNINQTVEFYQKLFNQPASKVKEAYAKFELENPSLIISFVENSERVQSNFGHLGIQVDSKDELEKRLESVRNTGLSILEEEGTNCCFALQDKFWVTDPDGVQWEVYYFHNDVEFNDPKYENQEAAACCTPPAKTKLNLAEITNSCC